MWFCCIIILHFLLQINLCMILTYESKATSFPVLEWTTIYEENIYDLVIFHNTLIS